TAQRLRGTAGRSAAESCAGRNVRRPDRGSRPQRRARWSTAAQPRRGPMRRGRSGAGSTARFSLLRRLARREDRTALLKKGGAGFAGVGGRAGTQVPLAVAV